MLTSSVQVNDLLETMKYINPKFVTFDMLTDQKIIDIYTVK
ncbi:MAG: hypothetical protein QXT40_03725 [Candidatus Micrarchaeia archaeon]